MNIMGFYSEGVVKRDYVSKSTGKAGSFDLVQGVIYPNYPKPEGAVRGELPVPRGLQVEPRGWHFVMIPLILVEDDWGNLKKPALNFNKAVFLDLKRFKSLKKELMRAFEIYADHFDFSKTLPDPMDDDDDDDDETAVNRAAAKHAVPVTQRPEGMTLANKV